MRIADHGGDGQEFPDGRVWHRVGVGFPSGKHLSAVKAEEARLAVEAGADEIDMVIDIGSALRATSTR